MTTLREEGELDLGVLVDGVLHRRFSLRPARLADTYLAAASVVVPANLADDQPARVAYQMAIDDAQILCQLESLGTLSMPLPSPQALAAELDPDDMDMLREAAKVLKKKLLASRSSLPLTDAPSTSSSGPASA